MLAAIVRAAVVSAPIGYLIAIIVEKTMEVCITIMEAAPASPSKDKFINAATLVQENFLLLVLVGILITLLARAHIESEGVL